MSQVRKFLDLSTAHLPERLFTGDDSLAGTEGVIAHDHGTYGLWVWVPDDPDDSAGAYDDFPPELLEVQRYARNLGCDYILFDCDADKIDDLPTWDW